jgi:hypothetical protein
MQCSCFFISFKDRLKATPEGFQILTKKDKKERLDISIEKRQEKFMIDHGFRLKDKLDDLMLRDAARAKAFAARLTLTDWQAINKVGGLKQADAPVKVLAVGV